MTRRLKLLEVREDRLTAIRDRGGRMFVNKDPKTPTIPSQTMETIVEEAAVGEDGLIDGCRNKMRPSG